MRRTNHSMFRAFVVTGLAPVLLAGSVSSAAPKQTPAQGPQAHAQTGSIMRHTLKLKLKESARLPDGLQVTFSSCTIESIAASPTDPKSYPAGSGIDIGLKLERGGASTDVGLTRLSEGYQSKTSERWQGYEISLGRIERAGSRDMTIEIIVVASAS